MTSRIGRVKQPNKSTRRSSAGLTLVEILISVALLSSGAVLVMHAYAKIWQTTRIAEHRAAAHMFALSKMADLELANHQGLELTRRPSGTFRADGHPYTWYVSAALSDPEHPEGPALVTLTVTWPRGGDTDRLQLQTLLRPTEPGYPRSGSATGVPHGASLRPPAPAGAP